MELTDWLLLALTLLGLAYIYATWTFDYWKKRSVPFVKPTPLFGNLAKSTFGKQSMGDDYTDVYKEFSSKGLTYGGFFKFREPCLMICDPDLLKLVTTSDFQHFHDNDIEISVDQDPMFGRNPFVLRGERWKKVRSQLTPAFTPGKLKPLFPLINEVCRDMKEYLEKDHPDGLEARDVAALFTTDVVASSIFGLNGHSFTNPKAEFRKMGRDIMAAGFWRNLEFMIAFMFPLMSKVLNIRLINEKVSNFFRGVVVDTMKYRDENGVTRNDFLQLLMQLKAKGSVEDGHSEVNKADRFTDEDVAAQTLTFFLDGFETSSGAFSFTLYELAVNQDVQERLREEVDAVMEVRTDGQLSYEMLSEMPYLDMVLAEALRKYPVLAYTTRLCTRPYELALPSGGSFKVAVGTSIALPVFGFHMNPEYFPEPERFLPERFDEETKASRHPSTYFPFGAGPRACLGSRFAQMQIKAGLASVIHNFELKLCARTSVPLVFDKANFLLQAKDGIWLKFLPRHK